jgi:GDP-L-fucose synthase
MSFYKGKNVLVTGGTGLIGRPLVEMLLEQEANVTIVSLDDPSRAPQGVTFKRADLREFSNCLAICQDQEIVFQLAGVKGSPAMTAKRPASFFVPTITFSINMMEAARRANAERFLFTSSVGVYSPAEVFYEDDVWKTFPSPNDRFAGWAKRMGELQAEAYKIEYNWDKISIVRPANVYGPYDNFDPANAMVIPSLIKRAMDGEKPLTVWGDGSPIRDFIHARDVARGMLLAVEKGINEPINLGSGTGVTIKEIAEIVAASVPGGPTEIVWDISKPKGDAKRLMDITRANAYGFKPHISIEEGIRETIAWYTKNSSTADNRYNAFTEKAHLPLASEQAKS